MFSFCLDVYKTDYYAESEEYSSKVWDDPTYKVSSGTAVLKDAVGEEDGHRVYKRDVGLGSTFVFVSLLEAAVDAMGQFATNLAAYKKT